MPGHFFVLCYRLFARLNSNNCYIALYQVLECRKEKQHGCCICVYCFSTTSTNVSIVSANEGKKCLVKSGKVSAIYTVRNLNRFNLSIESIQLIE